MDDGFRVSLRWPSTFDLQHFQREAAILEEVMVQAGADYSKFRGSGILKMRPTGTNSGGLCPQK